MSDLIRLEDVLAIIDKRTVKGKLQVAREVLKLPTIEARCETCEAFNKTRLLIPQPEPQRTGRWIHDGYVFKGGIDWMHCSECGHKDSWSVATRTPFCGWCGAKMEGE